MNSIALPDSLVTQLRSYEGRLRRTETLVAIAGGAVGLLATFLLLFVFDRFVDTPRVARTILTLSGGALAAWFAHAWARHWLWSVRGPAQLAKLLQRHFKTLGDRLQGVIELTETDQLPANISPALMRAAIRQVAEESGRFDFKEAVPVRPARRWTLAAIVLVAVCAAPFVFVPKAATNALARWAAPWAAIDRYTFASLEALPNELVVPHGEAFEIACGLRADSAWKPETATARLNDQEPQKAKLQEGRALFRLPGQTQNGRLSVRVGDATREITVRPLHRPEMKELAANVQLPDYLGYPPAVVPLQGSSAEFLEGSSVRFIGKTSRELQQAAMKSGAIEPAAEVQSETFVTPAKPVAELANEASFRWSDTFGLTPAQPYTIRVNTTRDAEPRVELQNLEQESAILPHEVMKVSFASSDDYGLKEAWLGWTVRGLGDKKEDFSAGGEAARTGGTQTTKQLTAAADFSPAWQKIPEDSVVELAAYALDYLPGRKPVESWKHTVYVLSPAKHAERVRERMDEVLKQLDERIRDEERQLEETKAISENKEALQTSKSGEDIKRVEASERANQEMLAKLTDEMREVMKDALRNKEVPEGTVADWQQLTEQLDQKANPPMGEAAKSLQQAGQQAPQREEQLAQAQQQQQAALEAMRNAANKMNTTNQNLYARNFYNRLRAAGAAEHKISDGLKGLAKLTAGLRPDEIPAEKRNEFGSVAGNQDNATKDVDGIVTDLGSFVKRVPNEKYDAVLKEMQEKRVVAELTELSGFVRANLGLKSVGRARQWGDQLHTWATMLQSECKSQGGDGEMDPDLLELIVALVRAAQAEDAIREQTELLEKRRESNPEHAKEAQMLAVQQEQLLKSIEELRATTKFDDVKPLLVQVENLMDEVAEHLHKPNTDKEVVSIESTIIELLVPPDKKGGKSGSMAKMQQMMRQMMAQVTKGGKPGQNAGRYASGLEGNPADGAALKDKNNTRTVEKAGGAANAGEWPEEFRDQLQAFFQQVEANRK